MELSPQSPRTPFLVTGWCRARNKFYSFACYVRTRSALEARARTNLTVYHGLGAEEVDVAITGVESLSEHLYRTALRGTPATQFGDVFLYVTARS